MNKYLFKFNIKVFFLIFIFLTLFCVNCVALELKVVQIIGNVEIRYGESEDDVWVKAKKGMIVQNGYAICTGLNSRIALLSQKSGTLILINPLTYIKTLSINSPDEKLKESGIIEDIILNLEVGNVDISTENDNVSNITVKTPIGEVSGKGHHFIVKYYTDTGLIAECYNRNINIKALENASSESDDETKNSSNEGEETDETTIKEGESASIKDVDSLIVLDSYDTEEVVEYVYIPSRTDEDSESSADTGRIDPANAEKLLEFYNLLHETSGETIILYK